MNIFCMHPFYKPTRQEGKRARARDFEMIHLIEPELEGKTSNPSPLAFTHFGKVTPSL